MFIDIKMCDNTTVELDADSLVYRVGGAVDMMGEGKEFALRYLERAVSNIYEDTGCSKCNIYLGTDTNYRIDVASLYGYKANRTGNRRPYYYDAIRSCLVTSYKAILVHGQEAEDEVGIQAYTYDNMNNYIVGAIDKDMDMIAGTRYNYATRKTVFIDRVEALRRFYTQLVTGDKSVDNIPGLYHCLLLDGEDELAKKFRYSRYKSKYIKVLAELDDELSMYQAAMDLYEQYGQLEKHGLNRIIEIGRLLWIRREVGELWVPPTERDFDYINSDTREQVGRE